MIPLTLQRVIHRANSNIQQRELDNTASHTIGSITAESGLVHPCQPGEERALDCSIARFGFGVASVLEDGFALAAAIDQLNAH